ncbi:hypothetical protein [Stenotrophomonas sp. PS02289]|uniref:hypothetical protein n=1 Tax=Stenotrophomonas sp. PS02289 TaxID=2991422 RepID=UPI00249A7872|nr:hypothetical protein [Stenotrophomonas sp. PS02289]
MTLEANRPASSIAVTAFHGIVVRKDALRAKCIPVADVLHALEATAPLDEDGELLSFGPSFGEEALHEFIRRLEALGLDYFTDYCTISADIPEWCALRASSNSELDA